MSNNQDSRVFMHTSQDLKYRSYGPLASVPLSDESTFPLCEEGNPSPRPTTRPHKDRPSNRVSS